MEKTNPKNNQLFALPISREYWRLAASEVHQLPKVVLAALFVSMRLALVSVRVPIAENLAVSFGFLVTSISGMICGPVLAVCAAFVTDILGFMLNGNGQFFIGYTINEMLGALIYALFLYRTRVSVVRLGASKLLINGCINICLGSLWSSIMYSKGFYYYLMKGLFKNVALLPIEIVLMVLLFQAIMPAARQMKLIQPQPTKRIPWF